MMHFVADTDAAENEFGISYRSRCRQSCSLQLRGGRIASQNYSGHHFYFIADADIEKSYIRTISARAIHGPIPV